VKARAATVLGCAAIVGACGGGKTSQPPTVYVDRPTLTVKVPSSGMEPTLHCARPGTGCEASVADEVVVQPLDANELRRGDIVLVRTPPEASVACGAGGRFVKRLIGLPGDNVHEDSQGLIWINGKELSESYVEPDSRREDLQIHSGYRNKTWIVPQVEYFFIGDNRAGSCDSREWGAVTGDNIVGRVTKIIRSR
jgi:signal peptidase I